MAHVANNSGCNEWYTPVLYLDAARQTMGQIDCDPASSAIANRAVGATTFFSKDQDGLSQLWHGRCNGLQSKTACSQSTGFFGSH